MAAKKKDSKTKRILMAILRYTVASLSMGIVLYMLFALFFSTKEERALERENRLYSNMYSAMKAKEELIGDVLEGLMERDDAIYEELFDTPPPSLEEVGGYRGVGVQESEALPERYYVKTAYSRSDSLLAKAREIDDNFAEVFRILQENADSIPPLTLPQAQSHLRPPGTARRPGSHCSAGRPGICRRLRPGNQGDPFPQGPGQRGGD